MSMALRAAEAATVPAPSATPQPQTSPAQAEHHPPERPRPDPLDAVAHRVTALTSDVGEPLARMLLEHFEGAGKQVRATIALQSCAALRVSEPAAVAVATACELLHNATLVHDDLQDGDRVRRGRPALWAQHGAAQAITAGDVLLLLPLSALDVPEIAPETRWRVAAAIARRGVATGVGQALELAVRGADTLSWAIWERIAQGKTGQFFALPVEAAALLAGRSRARAAALGDAVSTLGLLFQLRDDVLDLYGDKGRGARGNDLREGKPSALVVAHLERRPEDRRELMALLRTSRTRTRRADVGAWARRFEESGARADVEARIAAAERALAEQPDLQSEAALRPLVLGLARTLAGSVPPTDLTLRTSGATSC